MNVYVMGSGKLAVELLAAPALAPPLRRLRWVERGDDAATAIVVHAGSGRELPAAVDHCRRTGSTLIELATGSAVASLLRAGPPAFATVVCPNTNILMLKFLHLVTTGASLFDGLAVTVTESHQAGKASVPGTAVALADALDLPPSEIRSVRDPALQRDRYGIPADALDRHALHRVTVDDGHCTVTLESRVTGAAPYAAGFARIVAAVQANPLEPRLYAIDAFVAAGWI